jgi:hypothetical protein
MEKKIMKKLFLIAGFCVALACGREPLKEVPITEPWQSMELPMENNAKVWASDALQIKLTYSGSREKIVKIYTERFEAHGWVITSRKATPNQCNISFAKANVVLEVEVYDFEQTGVTIRRVV